MTRKGDWHFSDADRENHKDFIDLQPGAHKVELFVAAWLRSRGNDVQVLEHTIAPTRDEWHLHSDHGDLELTTPAGLFLRGEVKGCSRSFNHFRYPWPRYFLDATGKWDRKDPKPDWYYRLSADRKAIAAAPGNTPDLWGKCWELDHVSKRMQELYWVGREHVELFDLTRYRP